MADKSKNKMSKKVKIIITVLLVLVLLSAAALVGRVIYLNYFADNSATVVVPDNLISEDDTSSDTSGESSADETGGEASVPTDAAESKPAVVTKKAATISLYQGKPNDNEKFEVQNMLPGDVITKYYAVKVNHEGKVNLNFTVEVTEQTKSLAEVLNIKVVRLENNSTVYDGSFAEIDKNGYDEILNSNSAKETVAYYEITVSLPTSTGNEYQMARLMADFDWSVKDKDALVPPQTGDNSNTVLWAVLMISALSLILVLLLSRRKESEGE